MAGNLLKCCVVTSKFDASLIVGGKSITFSGSASDKAIGKTDSENEKSAGDGAIVRILSEVSPKLQQLISDYSRTGYSGDGKISLDFNCKIIKEITNYDMIGLRDFATEDGDGNFTLNTNRIIGKNQQLLIPKYITLKLISGNSLINDGNMIIDGDFSLGGSSSEITTSFTNNSQFNVSQGSKVTVDSNVTITNNRQMTIDGELINRGSIENLVTQPTTATLQNNTTGFIKNFGNIKNLGNFDNGGKLINEPSGYIKNLGTFYKGDDFVNLGFLDDEADKKPR